MYQFVKSLKSERAFFFYTGYTALYALLKSMEVKHGDEVITQVFTCPAVPSPIVRLGAKPVYVDIDPKTFNIDPNIIKTKITNKTKVIIAQHTYGIPAEMDSIINIAREHNLWVIEDSCHALGSKYKGQEVSTFGDAAIFSFGWYKPIVLGLGGAAVVNNIELLSMVEDKLNEFVNPPLRELFPLYIQYSAFALLYEPSRFWFMKEVYRRLRDFKNGPQKGNLGHLLIGRPFNLPSNMLNQQDRQIKSLPDESDHLLNMEISDQKSHLTQNEKFNKYRMVPFQEKRLSSKLYNWDDMVEHQVWIVSQYEKLLSISGYQLPDLESHLEPIYYKYPLLSHRKREIFDQARLARTEMSDMFGSPLYPPERRANWEKLGYREGMCPISEKTSAKIIALPIHSKVQVNDIKKTLELLASFS